MIEDAIQILLLSKENSVSIHYWYCFIRTIPDFVNFCFKGIKDILSLLIVYLVTLPKHECLTL